MHFCDQSSKVITLCVSLQQMCIDTHTNRHSLELIVKINYLSRSPPPTLIHYKLTYRTIGHCENV